MACPNCSREHGVLDECALGVLLGVVSDRLSPEPLTPEMVARVFEVADVSFIWDQYLGPAVDYVEDVAKGEKP